jgi:ATP-dependent Clp protease adaptor protein ClpS
MEDLKTKQDTSTKRPKQYVVKFLNDDFTSFDLVVGIIVSIFKKSAPEAEGIAKMIHTTGSGIVGGPYTLEIAESKLIMTEHTARKYESPLKASVEEA